MKKNQPSRESYNRSLKKNLSIKRLALLLIIMVFTLTNAIDTFAKNTSNNSPAADLQQQRSITGTVSDKSGGALPGVNIVVTGTTVGSITGMDGKYTLSVPAGSKSLTFSFIGMDPQEVQIGASNVIDITMVESATTLEEVVVVGYGTQIKSSVTGSISSVKSNQLQNINVTNVAAALNGVVSGAFVTSQGGAPGASSNIYLRGPVSLSGGSPLYVVDGVPMEDLGYSFNMDDIESINVLKDASAAAIYGAKAAAGVILVTTKRGAKSVSPSINFNATYGVRNVFNLPKLFTRDEYIPAKALAGYNVVDLFGPESGWKNLPDTDWFSEWYSPGAEQNYGLSMTGGGGASTYFVSGNYNNIVGTQRNNWIKRYTFRVNSDHQITKRIKFTESIYLKAGNEKPAGRLNEGLLTFRSIPMMLVYDPTNLEGGYGMDPKGFQGSNNVARYESLYRRDHSYTGNVSGTLDVMIIEGLHLNALLGVNLDYVDSYQYQYYYNDGAFASQRNFNNLNSRNLTKIGTYTLNYNKKFGVHRVSALLGYEARERDFGNVNYANRDAYVDEPQTSAVALGIANQSGSFLRNNVLDRILSQFARVEYDYNGKYLLTGNIRRDGYGSKFGPANRFGIFPGASVGWLVSKEDFLSQFSFINMLKVRAGYGLLGNAVGQDFAYTKYYESGFSWDWSQNPGAVLKSTGLAIVSKLANPDIQWEEVATMNIGLDLSILNNRVSLALDYYSRQTKKMLYNVAISPSAGVGPSVPANIGQMSNKGIEFQLTHRNQVGDFTYDVTVNGGFNRNKLISLNPALERLYITSGDIGTGESGTGFYGTVAPCRSEPGQPLGQFYGLQTAGIYDTDAAAGTRPTYGGFTPQAGDLIYVDRNGDGLINTLDYTQIGNPWPKLTYGITLGASWKGIDVKAIFTGVLGNDIYNAMQSWEYNFFSDYNTTSKIYETSFFGTNGVTAFPRADNLARPDRNKNWGAISDFHVEKGSYMRMSNLQIGYNLPAPVTRFLKIESTKVFISADNLFTLTKYTGMDPEIPAQAEYGGILAQGLDLTSRRYPLSRIISVGVNVKF